MNNLEGIVPPLLLPLQELGEIDYQSFARLINYLVAGGVDGLWVNGSTGEFFGLSDEERCEVVRAAVQVAAGRERPVPQPLTTHGI